MKKNKIEHIVGHAKITKGATGGTPCEVEIYDCEVKEELTSSPATPADKPRQKITAGKVIVATGSVARDLPFAKFDGDKIWGAREAMYNKEQPKSLIVIGSGAIGMEFGYFYKSFGTDVTVVEMMDRILPVEDEDVSKAMLKHYKKAGFNFELGHTLTDVDTKGKGVKVTIAPMKDGKPDESKTKTIEAEKMLLAIGVKGRFDGLFDDSLGIEIVKDHIKTDYVPIGPESPMEPKAAHLQDERQRDLRDRRRHRPALARPRRQRGGDPLRRAHRLQRWQGEARAHPDGLHRHPGVHLLQPPGRQRRVHRAGPQGQGPQEGRGLRGGELPAPVARQGDRLDAQRGLRQDHPGPPARRDPRCPHHGRPGDRTHRRVQPRPPDGGDHRGTHRDRACPPDDARGCARGGGSRARGA